MPPVISAGDLVARMDAFAKRLDVEVEYDNDEPDGPREITYGRLFFDSADALREAAARIQELEVEIEAAKQFGGGFFGTIPTEATREIYRQQARSSLNQDGWKP